MFRFVKALSGENFQTLELHPTTASEAYKAGELLKLTAGGLTKAGATDKPEYIAAETYTAPATGAKELPVYPVIPHHVLESTFAADATAVKAGDKVTLHTDGLQLTATTTAGVATIVRKLGSGAAGTKALIKFI